MNEERIIRLTSAELSAFEDVTDWERVSALTDADIERAITEDPDAAPRWTALAKPPSTSGNPGHPITLKFVHRTASSRRYRRAGDPAVVLSDVSSLRKRAALW